MRVLDASVVIDALAVTGPAGTVARSLLAAEAPLHVPALLRAEVCNGLCAMVRRGTVSPLIATALAVRAGELHARSYPFEPFLRRAWELRDNVTTYDAWYVALAERLDAALVTTDERLQRATGPRCRVITPEQALTEW